MSALDTAIAHFRRRAMEHERAAATALVDAYGFVWSDLQGQLDRLTADIAEAQGRGETVSRAWLARQSRYQALLAQTEERIRQYSQYAERTVLAERRAAVDAAQAGALDLLQAALGPNRAGAVVNFNRLPVEAIDRLVGALSPDSPLRQLFDGWGPQASKAAGEALVSALAEGVGPRKAAKQLRDAVHEVSGARALLISRQEINRTFRESSLETYKANADALEGWTWVAAGSRRTCAVCFAKHGTVHKLDERFASHICCRCCAAPLSKSWDALGFKGIPDNRPTIEDGATLFGRLSEADQRHILGAGKYDLFARGLLQLADLIAPTRSRTWGPGMRERTLRELQARIDEREAAD
jgi:SPP1 gp7 family putative phage head morphogenesis protein